MRHPSQDTQDASCGEFWLVYNQACPKDTKMQSQVSKVDCAFLVHPNSILTCSLKT